MAVLHRRVLTSVAAFVVGITLGAAGTTLITDGGPIPPTRVRQVYGQVSSHTGDRLCIVSDRMAVCGRLRTRPEDPVAGIGEQARGGYAHVPSDSSDVPEPSWLWVTPMASSR